MSLLRMRKILPDSSYLYALHVQNEKRHQRSRVFANENKNQLIAPEVVIVEVCYLLNRVGGLRAKLQFLNQMDSDSVLRG